ncbi:hypothetical protein JW879_03175 [candidate division WOR-3 bacterium]|nr:hypothetical protein [candidate division WOR-3 bacterium]
MRRPACIEALFKDFSMVLVVITILLITLNMNWQIKNIIISIILCTYS